MIHKLALVLGGGGAAGNAWLIGIVAGLAEAGFDLTKVADLVIGTSAGATTAAQVRSGLSPADLLASTLTPPTPPAGPRRDQPQSAMPMEAVFDRMRAISAAANSVDDLARAMGAFGLEADPFLGPAAAAQRRALVASRLPRPEWPQRPMRVTAIEARTGRLIAFDSASGAELADAVTASTALPGMAPTVAIQGVHYISGGIRSNENANLATGYASVVVLSPLAGRDPAAEPSGQFEGLRRFPGTTLPDQVEELRRQGSRVEVITPDAASRAAMGTNQMDLATRIPSARAGLAQGKADASRIAPLLKA